MGQAFQPAPYRLPGTVVESDYYRAQVEALQREARQGEVARASDRGVGEGRTVGEIGSGGGGGGSFSPSSLAGLPGMDEIRALSGSPAPPGSAAGSPALPGGAVASLADPFAALAALGTDGGLAGGMDGAALGGPSSRHDGGGRVDFSHDPSFTGLGPHPLAYLCMESVVAQFSRVESLVGLPDSVRPALAARLCALRTLTPKAARTLAAGFPAELSIPDCTQLTPADLADVLADAASPRCGEWRQRVIGTGNATNGHGMAR